MLRRSRLCHYAVTGRVRNQKGGGGWDVGDGMGDEKAENNEYVNIRRRVEFRIDLEKQ